MENLVHDVLKRMKSLKNSVHAAIHSQCPNTTCPNTTCAEGWVSYQGSCYLFENGEKRNFQEAKDLCAQFGAVLLYVRDEAENKFIVGMIDRMTPYHWTLGLTDQANEGVWKWSDTNAAVEFTDWTPGEPQGGTSENCVVYYNRPSHTWVDTSCFSKYFSIWFREGAKMLLNTGGAAIGYFK